MRAIIGLVDSQKKVPPSAPVVSLAEDTGSNRDFDNGAASLTWTTPTFNGKSAIVGYDITATDEDNATVTFSTGVVNNSSITGLKSGKRYTYRIKARNGGGAGLDSAGKGPVTATTKPNIPLNVTATNLNNGSQATVSWTAGANGGSTITGYTVTTSPGGATTTTTNTNVTVGSLTNNLSYTFTVTATNANGTSSPSNASSPITITQPIVAPVPPPSPPSTSPCPQDSGGSYCSGNDLVVNRIDPCAGTSPAPRVVTAGGCSGTVTPPAQYCCCNGFSGNYYDSTVPCWGGGLSSTSGSCAQGIPAACRIDTGGPIVTPTTPTAPIVVTPTVPSAPSGPCGPGYIYIGILGCIPTGGNFTPTPPTVTPTPPVVTPTPPSTRPAVPWPEYFYAGPPPGFTGPPSAPVPRYPYYCLDINALIPTPNGDKRLADLIIGDQVITAKFKEIDPEDPNADLIVDTWSIDNLTYEELDITTIVNIRSWEEQGRYTINNRIKCTGTHPFIAKEAADGRYYYTRASSLVEGDMLFDGDLEAWVPVTKIDYEPNVRFTVRTLSTEPYDMFFAEGILVHNK